MSKAFVLVKHGLPETAFELREVPDPPLEPTQVRVEVEAFGLNFADIMARKGAYQDCPPLPTVIGYEVVGRIIEMGKDADANRLAVGKRVVAFTRFGGYARSVVSPQEGVVVISEEMEAGKAAALAVQYSTAWYCAEEAVTLFPGDHVLVQAAAGGVGTALVQMAKRKGCIVYGTAGSAKKLEYLRKQGVDHPINYREQDFEAEVRKLRGEKGLDFVFDSLGGKTFKKGHKLLAPGGRIVGFGAASRSGKGRNIFADIKLLLGFGFYNPAFMLMSSQGIIGVNMLRIADHKRSLLQWCLESVVKLTESGDFNPVVGGVFTSAQLPEAHHFLEGRKSTGKVIVTWE